MESRLYVLVFRNCAQLRFRYYVPFTPGLCSWPAVCSHSSSGWFKWHIWRNDVNGETVRLLSELLVCKNPKYVIVVLYQGLE
jgi:hypothetical protein